MNEDGKDYVSTPFGLVFPAVKGDSWMVRTGITPITILVSVWFAPHLDGFPRQSDYMPLKGKIAYLDGTSERRNSVRGGPGTLRGLIPETGYVLIVPRSLEDESINVHLQVGRLSFVGLLSTEDLVTYVIEEETTVEDLLNVC